MMNHSCDIAILGGGPGGYVAAIRAAQLGFKTILVEREHLGGICLNWGCIPTKTLLRTSEINHYLHNLDAFGLSAKDPEIHIEKIVARSRAVANQLSTGIAFLMKKNKIEVIKGHGKLLGNNRLGVFDAAQKQTDEIKAPHIILATGARARTLPNIEPDGKLIWSYKEAMTPTELPKTLAVIGSGAIGIEFASFYNDLGVDVTVIEAMDRVVPAEDKEISDFASKILSRNGLKLQTNAQVESVTKHDNNVSIKFSNNGNPATLLVDRVILAVGIVGNVENIGLENSKVKVDRTHIVADEWSKTDEPGVYAIGDLTGPPWLAHKASHEGIICVEKIKGLNNIHPLKQERIPKCTYCRPQIASVGITEEEARNTKRDIKIGRFPFMGNGKAIAMGETDGMVKTIFDNKTGELLGAHMIGAEVTELIQGYAIAMNLETTEEDLMHTIFPHPTLSEMMHESVLNAYDKALHI
jgi:dihydrolipoyl dehydrogenase